MLLENAPAKVRDHGRGGPIVRASSSPRFAAAVPRATAAAARAGRMRVHVADGDGQRVGGVVRRRQRGQSEQQLHHLLHLVLLGAAVTDHGALDLGGRVFDDRHAGLHRGQHRHAARMTKLQRAADVHGVEQILDRDAVGPALGRAAPPAGDGWSRACRETTRAPACAMAPHMTSRWRDPSVSTQP